MLLELVVGGVIDDVGTEARDSKLVSLEKKHQESQQHDRNKLKN